MDMDKVIEAFCNTKFIKEAVKSDEYLGRKKTDHFDVDGYNLFLNSLVDEKRNIEYQELCKRKRPLIYPLASTHLVIEKLHYLFKCLVIEKKFKDGKELIDLALVPYIGELLDGTIIVKPMTAVFNIEKIQSAKAQGSSIDDIEHEILL